MIFTKRKIPSEAGKAYLFCSPLLFFFLFFIVYPLGLLIYLSFCRQFVGMPREFIGLENFRSLFMDPVFWQVVRNTGVFVVGDVTIKILLAFGAALLLNQEFIGRRLVRALVLIPWMIPMVPAVFTWRWMLHRELGIINRALVGFHLIGAPIDWLGEANLALLMVILVHVWKYFPFFTLMILAGLQAIPTEIYEASIVDGANRWQKFRFITLPSIRGVLITLYLLSGVWTLGEFVTIWLLTRGGPLYGTHVLATLGFLYAFRQSNLGLASAVFVWLLPFTLGLIFIVSKLLLTETGR